MFNARHIICMPWIIIFSATANTSEYTANTSYEVSSDYNDNVRLAEGDVYPVKIMGYATAFDLDLSAKTQTLNTALNLDLISSVYDVDEFSSDDQNLDFSIEKNSQLLVYGFDVGINRDSTRTSEFQDSGLITQASRREEKWYSGHVKKVINSKNLFLINGSTRVVNYETDDLTGYDYDQIDLSWYHTLSPRVTLISKVFYSLYDGDLTAARQSSNDTAGLFVGGEFSLSESWSLNVLLGSEQVDSETELLLSGSRLAVVSETNHSGHINTKLKYSGQQQQASLAVVRQVQPSGLGYEQVNESITYTHNYKISPLTDIAMVTRYGVNESIAISQSDKRTYSSVKLLWRKKLSKVFTVSMSYSYLQQDRDSIVGKGDLNTVTLGMVYKPATNRWSR